MVQSTKVKFDNPNMQPNFAVDAGKMKLSDREDAQSIQKAQTLFQSLSLSQEPALNSLEERVSLDSPISLERPALDPEHFQAINAELNRLETSPEPHEVNFLIKVREVIANILAKFSEISERDRVQTDDMKARFRKASQESADLQRSLGSAGLWIAGISFAVLLSQFGFKNPADREVIKFLSEQCPHVGGMFTSRTQANQKEADALSQLMLAEYNAKTSKTQSESSSKQEIVNLLDKTLESM